MTIKLSELEAKRKAMTPGPWREFDDPADLGRGIDSESGDTVLFAEPIGECNPRLIASDADLIGIVATHNAADALIAIARAALELKRANEAHMDAVRNLTVTNGSDAAGITLRDARSGAIKALDNLDAALAEVAL